MVREKDSFDCREPYAIVCVFWNLVGFSARFGLAILSICNSDLIIGWVIGNIWVGWDSRKSKARGECASGRQ